MSALAKPVGFSVALILAFASVTYVLPQMKGEAPDEKEAEAESLTMASFIAMGEKLYQGKGTCALCHNKLGRAPDLLAFNVSKVSEERLKDTRYRGKARDVEGYLRESMVEPSAYVVEGFGKKGSNDTESPMPAAHKPPIQLSAAEVSAIIAYLQNKDGNPVTVALPASTAPASGEKKEEAGEPKPTLAQGPEEALMKFGCAACHTLLKTESTLGPSLNDVGKRLNVDQIRESIVAPKAVIAKGYAPIMPEFPMMTVTELEMIVQFLAKRTGGGS